jgi:hypothetical protein
MTKTRRTRKSVTTTIGDLLAAAWEAVPGIGAARAQRVAVLLAATPLSHRANRRIQFSR